MHVRNSRSWSWDPEELHFHAFPPSPLQSSIFRVWPDDDVHLHPERHREDGLPQEDHQETRGPDTQVMQVHFTMGDALKLNAEETVSSSASQAKPCRATGQPQKWNNWYQEAQVRTKLMQKCMFGEHLWFETWHDTLTFCYCCWRWFNGFSWEGLKAKTLSSPLKRAVSINTGRSNWEYFHHRELKKPPFQIWWGTGLLVFFWRHTSTTTSSTFLQSSISWEIVVDQLSPSGCHVFQASKQGSPNCSKSCNQSPPKPKHLWVWYVLTSEACRTRSALAQQARLFIFLFVNDNIFRL